MYEKDISVETFDQGVGSPLGLTYIFGDSPKVAVAGVNWHDGLYINGYRVNLTVDQTALITAHARLFYGESRP